MLVQVVVAECIDVATEVLDSVSVRVFYFFFSSRRRHTRFDCDWSSDVCSSDLLPSERTRSVAAVGAATIQLGILLLMNVGNFPLVMLAACVLFVRPQWIHRVAREPAVPAAASGVRVPRRRVAGWLLAVVAAAAFVTAVPSEAEMLRPRGGLASPPRSLSPGQPWGL